MISEGPRDSDSCELEGGKVIEKLFLGEVALK